MDVLSLTFFRTSFLIFLFKCRIALDTISLSQSLRDGNTLVSGDGSFELGFFSPGDSKNRYVGIWYKKIRVRTVVWVANRQNPITDTSGLLMINSIGNLVLLSQNQSAVWSSNSTKEAQSPIVQLLDSGNLVLRDEKDGDSQSYLWQSFDYPTDTLLPGMQLGWDLKTGFDRHLSAWKNSDDPSPGDFSWGIELQDNPEAVIWRGSKKYYRSGPWNGLSFSGSPELRSNPLFQFSFVSNEEEVYYVYYLKDKSLISRVVLNQTIYLRQRFVWSEESQTWKVYASVPRDYCDSYGLCGAYGNCIISQSPVCQCLEGFKPKIPDKWNSMDWSGGCTRNKPLNCTKEDGFLKFEGLKLPDARHSWVYQSMNLRECRAKCLENCSCMAYANSDIRGGGSGCAMWFDNLIDIRQIDSGGEELYIRISASELKARGEPKKRIAVIIGITALAIVAGMLMVLGFCRIRKNLQEKKEDIGEAEQNIEQSKEDMELPLFDLATIAKATNNFSFNKKLGEGGFGPVYKGLLADGQEIAVKRLSTKSGQGLNEFKNEVKLIAKLQHRNLVKLLGCCIEGDEKMLIYEFMPNKSLDFFIFDEITSKLLDWPKRFNIISGIARGLLYLHQDSRLRIIHRDLKASNVLLDHEMNPKISDFGMARTFGGDQSEGNTNRVVGTYGYMAPEYAIDGQFSVKSDVFSFGILMLEIISGKKNRGFYHQDKSVSLIGHAWKLWKEGRPLELADDAFLGESCALSEVVRCLHISILCVQHHPEDRPSMPSVVLMLGGQSALPQPNQPGFLSNKDNSKEVPRGNPESSSTNEITVTILEPR
ncbi:PREDICTED: G-type lectin S-receptor-like serine/threonine-protein kinase At4g27290 [Theobroma cacao]|uniref:Receptor-like serine/threonine-protein kinase n=1 Tax=Theobroma cacao TaxID=3641 RepID=A0AB32WRU9_THECC|nr:PREDICTED: G-type lectin S-receptor-like serine/threonine-protein kinase At4g27290 [Theobroma cacao]